ncbi:unnamed protein product [Durusdinium trenchii]|uniref:Sodium/hydrogen exchanger n=1 Tax=Durusdinium trenchii TaxID=1381693 RepID=A0ABP0SI24_9DINO
MVDRESLAATSYCIYLVLLLVSFCLSFCLATRCRSCTYFSEAGASLLVGFLGGGLLTLLVREDASDRFSEKEVQHSVVGFSSTVLFCVLLPPIIFDSGFRMRGAFFWANIDKIMVLAFVGTLLSSLVVGFLLVAVSGILPFAPDAPDGPSSISLPEALSFGALISATDPVTTLAIFEQLQVDPHLFNVVFGESVLNDAVSIVLFHSFSKAIGAEEKNVLVSICGMTMDFVVIFVGSAIIGASLGCLSALLFKHVDLPGHTAAHGPKLELAVFLVFCYAPFLLADGAGLSGIVAILFTGITMKRYTFNNLSPDARETVQTIVSLMASCAETLVFIDLGTSAWESLRADIRLVAYVFLCCLLGRAVNVYTAGLILNATQPSYPRRPFETNDMHMVWFAGLRGAIAFALSTQFKGPHRHSTMALAMWVVLISVWFLGGATAPMLSWLRIRRCEPEQLKQLALTLEPAVKRLTIVRWDQKYLSPWLLRMASPPSSPSRGDTEAQDQNAGSDAARAVRLKTTLTTLTPSYTSCELQDIAHSQLPDTGREGAPHASPLLTAREVGDEAE